jgi:FkbM family methyltransferase
MILAGLIMRAIFRDTEEQGLIREFFGHRDAGFFVDVGAADPQVNSQSWHLEQLGWSGVLVEPRPEFAEKLRCARRAQVFEAACSSPRNAGRTMTLRVRGGLSTLNGNLVVAGLKPHNEISVQIRTLDDVLVEAQAPRPIDFLSIDVEGHETELLDGFDLARWQPRLLLIEDHAKSLKLHRLIQQRGYKWVRRTGLNAWYVPADSAMDVAWFGRLQFFRKYHLGRPPRHIRDTLRRLRIRLGVLPPRYPE